ncbi:MAG: hypothetical protein JSS20_21465, partial [Proteobacteria bacterium]|nr:hypothetical protein [Pseudomonadota bacterium]
MSTESLDATSVMPEAKLGRGFAVRLALFFTSLFLVAGTKLPYLALWLD